MIRYENQQLPPQPRIAVIANDAIGNFVVGTPLLQMLQAQHAPSAVDYFGGTRTAELSESSDLIDTAFHLHGTEPRQAFDHLVKSSYDLVVNMEWTPTAMVAAAVLSGDRGFVCGPCVGSGGRDRLAFPKDETGKLWADQQWIRESLVSEYSFLHTGFIGEIFCRLAYLEGPVPRYKVPTDSAETGVDVLIACSASLPDKIWPLEKWVATLESLREHGKTAGLLGAPPKVQREFWKGDSLEDQLVERGLVQDLRGKLLLPEVVGALASAQAVLTLDNGILHLACATETPTVGLFRYGIHRLWAPPVQNLTVLTPEPDQTVEALESAKVIAALLNCFA